MRDEPDLSAKDAIELSIRYGESASKIIQFFFVFGIAIGGWVVAATDISGTQPLSAQRIAVVVILSVVGFSLTAGLVAVIRKKHACYRLALARSGHSRELRIIASKTDDHAAVIGMVVSILLADYALLFLTRT